MQPGETGLSAVRDDGAGTAQIMMTVTDRQKRNTVYRYWLEQKEAGWRISGVVPEQRPPPRRPLGRASAAKSGVKGQVIITA